LPRASLIGDVNGDGTVNLEPSSWDVKCLPSFSEVRR